MGLSRHFVLALLIVLPARAAAAAAAAAAAEDQQRQPNIIFIMSDDHCAQAISAYGSKVNETPNIDRLAQEGMRFDNCFVTNGICAPSRAVILTGLHSHLNGKTTNGPPHFDGAQLTFPKVLQGAGYETAMIGKWHLRTTPTGFDYFDVLIGQGPYYNPAMRRSSDFGEQFERVERVGYTTDIITDLAIEWLTDGRDAQKPFMLMMHHKAPHRNWQPGPAHLHDYEDVEIPAPPTLFDDWSGRGTASAAQEMTIARHLSDHDLKLAPQGGLTEEQLDAWEAAYAPRNEAFRKADLEGKALVEWKYQRYAKDYLRCVASVDDSVGRVLDFLQEQGLADDTIVVYTSDQGWFLGEHGWYDKRWMYEESLRMPLLVRWPGVTAPGSTNTNLVQNLDFAPTFLDAAGAITPEPMQGESLVPLLGGEAAPWRSSVYYHYYEYPAVHSVARHDGVRTDRYKLIDFYQLEEWELYDLVADPDEMTNVAGDPRYAEIESELRGELERLRRHYRVPSEHGRAGAID